jgi:hypothetical protein
VSQLASGNLAKIIQIRSHPYTLWIYGQVQIRIKVSDLSGLRRGGEIVGAYDKDYLDKAYIEGLVV